MFALCAFIIGTKFFMLSTAKPNITINYVEKNNQLTKPINFDPAQNAAPLYDKAFANFYEMPNALRDSLDEYESNLEDTWPGDLDSETLEQLEQWHKLNKTAFDYLTQAAKKPYIYRVLSDDNNWAFMAYDETLGELRDLTRSLLWRAKLQMSKGNFDAGLADLGVIMKIAQQYQDSGRLGTWHCASSINRKAVESCLGIIVRTKCPPDKIANLCKPLQPPLLSFKAEEYASMDFIQQIYTDDGNGNGRIIPGQVSIILQEWSYLGVPGPRSSRNSWYDLANVFKDISSAVKQKFGFVLASLQIHFGTEDRDTVVQRVKTMYRRTGPELVANNPAKQRLMITKSTSVFDGNWIPVYLYQHILTPAWTPGRRYHRDNAVISAIRTIAVIMSYQQDHKDLPASLEDLVTAGYLEELPIDPYSDKPLVYKLIADDNFTLYSLGKDFDDDGGIKQYDYKDKDGDNIYWPIPKPKKIEMVDMNTVDWSTLPGMPTPQPSTDPNQIT